MANKNSGLIHLVLNLVVWIAIGCILEPDWGAWRTAAVFFFSAMTGNLLSVALDPLNISVGTSGGIYGAMAALNIYVLEYWTTIHKPKSTILIIIGTTLLSLATSFVPYIDTYAHLVRRRRRRHCYSSGRDCRGILGIVIHFKETRINRRTS